MKDLLPEVDLGSVGREAGWPGIETFPLAHLAWLRRHQSEEWRRAARFAMNNDWLSWRLTGRWGIDHSTATTFYLQDQVSRTWNRRLLDALGIPEPSLSPLLRSGTALGQLTPQASRDTGLTPDTLLVLGGFDHPCAARGTGTVAPGDLLISCGTSWVGFYPCRDRDLLLSCSMLVDPFLSPGGPWGGMFSLSAIGVTVDWLVETFVAPPNTTGAEKLRHFNDAAAAAPPGANGLFINPLRMIAPNAPRLQQLQSRGREAVARAVMEGTAFEMRRRLETMASAGLDAERIAMVGGPSESPVWPRILAEATGRELKLGDGQIAGAVGAAILAGTGSGLFKDLADGIARCDMEGKLVSPSSHAVRSYAELFEEYRNTVDRPEADSIA
jgi:sugar (pentulose or hexulose) kinase